MEKLNYTVNINAPVQTVWATMLDDATYREWTGEFYEGSYFEGTGTKAAKSVFSARTRRAPWAG